MRDHLASFGATVSEERVVIDRRIVTGSGVSAGIDMALTLLARTAGETTAQTVQLAIEYDPQPPFNAGSPASAPGALRAPALELVDPALARTRVPGRA